jgi:hypothetical protein
LTSQECASGGCFRLGDAPGRCSTCFGPNQCGAQTCAPSWDGGPVVCGGGQGTAASGAPCGADGDCASGHCNGSVRRECDDGRPCISPADCPFGANGEALQNGACTTVGIQGGTCQ